MVPSNLSIFLVDFLLPLDFPPSFIFSVCLLEFIETDAVFHLVLDLKYLNYSIFLILKCNLSAFDAKYSDEFDEFISLCPNYILSNFSETLCCYDIRSANNLFLSLKFISINQYFQNFDGVIIQGENRIMHN